MNAWEFHGMQWLTVGSSDNFNPQPNITIEALCQLLEPGDNPTILCRPSGITWQSPHVTWRLGFYSDQRKPEFQILFKGDGVPITVRSETSIALHEIIHLAGVYDGEWVKLYVNGTVVASERKKGTPAQSSEKVVIGVRSSTDEGGYFIGRIFDLRCWRVARTAEAINFWKNRTLPYPISEEGCIGYWHTAPRLDLEVANSLAQKGFSSKELAFLDFLTAYSEQYSQSAEHLLDPTALTLYPPQIHTTVAIKHSDGFLVFYEPAPPPYRSKLYPGLGADTENGGLIVLNPPGSPVSESLQGLTGNAIKISIKPATISQGTTLEFPEDSPFAVDWMFSEDLRSHSTEPPRVQVLAIPSDLMPKFCNELDQACC